MLKQLKRILAVLLISTSAFADISTEAVTAHNKWRDMLNNGELKNQPRPAPFLSSMIWNQELADSATLHSQRCVWEHGSSGENLYAHTGHGGSMTHGVDLWANEYKNYDYQTNKSTGGMVGHYTQVVWARSVRVGCGKAYCPMIAKSDGSNMWGGTIYTCRYSQAGNYYGQRPYGTAGYKGDEFAKFNETNGDIEVPTITFNGHMYRLKMSKIGPWEKYYKQIICR